MIKRVLLVINFVSMSLLFCLCMPILAHAQDSVKVTYKGELVVSMFRDLYSLYSTDCKDCQVEIIEAEMEIDQYGTTIDDFTFSPSGSSILTSWTGGRTHSVGDFSRTVYVDKGQVSLYFYVKARMTTPQGHIWVDLKGRTSFVISGTNGNVGTVNVMLNEKVSGSGNSGSSTEEDWYEGAETAVDWFKKGADYTNKGDWGKAIACFTKAIEYDPGNSDYYVVRGNAYYQAGNIGSALEDFKKACELGDAEACGAYEAIEYLY